jgi:hypothetical protein
LIEQLRDGHVKTWTEAEGGNQETRRQGREGKAREEGSIKMVGLRRAPQAPRDDHWAELK